MSGFIYQFATGHIRHLPPSKTTQNAAYWTTHAKIEPPNLTVLIERKSDSYIARISRRLALNARPLLWFSVFPMLFAIANEVLPIAGYALPLCTTLIVVCPQKTLFRTTL